MIGGKYKIEIDFEECKQEHGLMGSDFCDICGAEILDKNVGLHILEGNSEAEYSIIACLKCLREKKK